MKRLSTVLAAAALIVAPAAPAAAVRANTTYYVNCSATTNGNGTSAPWNNLASVSATTFGPGDQILFQPGTTCTGQLTPKGSGSSGSPITIGVNGTGTAPKIVAAAGSEYAVKLTDQSWWTITGLDITGGTTYGVFVTVNAGLQQGITLSYLTVHDVTPTTAPASKNTGLVVVSPSHDKTNSTAARFNNVKIDHVTAYNTTMWAGIIVGSGTDAAWATTESLRSTNVTVSYSVVHDILGDGIVLYAVNNGVLEHNVASVTGKGKQTIGTPNAIWTWACNTCTVQYNEAFRNDSSDVDGGAFDIDYYSKNTTVQYNYGHDNSAYCVAVFAAGGVVTSNSVIRYNICANNGTQPGNTTPPKNDGFRTEIYVQAWDNGTIDGLQIYGNTFVTAHGAYEAVNSNSGAMFSGSGTLSFANNLVYATVADPDGDVGQTLRSDNNLWYTTAGSFKNTEPNSVFADPRLVAPGHTGDGDPGNAYDLQSTSPAIDAGLLISGVTKDFRGNPVPRGTGFDIGALESPYSS